MRIARDATLASLSWAVFLGLLALLLLRNVPLWILTALTSLAATAALVLPAGFSVLASAALLAGLFALAARLTRWPVPRPRRSEQPSRLRQPRSSVLQPLAPVLFFGGLLSLANSLAAAPPADAPAAVPNDAKAVREDRVHRVIVPRDDNEQPTGKYYVPEELFAQLYRQAAVATGQASGWLITRAEYTATLTRDPATNRLGLARANAMFGLRVIQPNAPVGLPLARGAWESAIAAVKLDGRPVATTWSAAGDTLLVGNLPADNYRLEIELRPTLQADGPTTGFDLPIPPLPQAVFALQVPVDSPEIEILGARGRVQTDRDRGELRAHLGGASRLAARWSAGGTDAAPPNLEVDELIWIKVRPGATVLDARFKFRVQSGRVRRLQMLADSRLRLLSSSNAQSPVIAVHTIPGDPQRIELELAREVTDKVDIDLSFLVTGTSGVGILGLPRLESSDAKASRRWLAVSVDPALQSKVQTGDDSRPLEINDFLSAWGTADIKPASTFRVSRGEANWRLATQPSEPQTAVEQTLAVSLGRGPVTVSLDAALAITGGVLAQLELQGPAGLQVERVSVLGDEVDRVTRWSVDQAGRITVFLSAPLDGKQRLLLTGRWEAPPGEIVALPEIRMLSADVKKNQLQVFRQAPVLVSIEQPQGMRPVDPPASLPTGLGALVGCFQVEDPAASLAIKLAPNRPQLRAVAATFLNREQDRWMAELDLHVDVSDGLADTLQFDISPQWSEPLRVEPEMRSKIVSVPGEQRRQLVLYPPKPLSGHHNLKIRGRVALSPGDRLSVPDILPTNMQQAERFVVLPQLLERQQITWDTLGLSRAQLPAELAARGAKLQSAAVYQVAGERFQASLKAVQRSAASPQVRLADIEIAWQSDGSYQGVAAFDFVPGGSPVCLLDLPSGCELLHATVESLPALALRQSDTRWQLNLGPQQLAQRIELVYRGRQSGSTTRHQFRPPRLAELDPDEVLWTIYSPPGFGMAEPRDSKWVMEPADQQLKRLESTLSLVELPPEVVGEHLPEEIARWYGPWRRRYSTARAALRWESNAPRRLAAPSGQETKAGELDNQMAKIDARLGAARALRTASTADTSALLAEQFRSQANVAYFATDGQAPSLDLRYSRSPLDPALGRWLLALLMLATGTAATVWLRRHVPSALPPWGVLAVLATVTWLVLAPSVWGLAVLMLIGMWQLRVHWPQARAV